MKKLFSLLLIFGLGCFAIGCGGDPGVSVETEVTEEEEAGNEAAAAMGDGLGPEGEAGDAGGGGEAGATSPDGGDNGLPPE